MRLHEEKINVLLVEDNPGDIQLIKLVLNEAHPNLEIISLPDGEEALGYLEICLSENRNLPQLILLDLNLPKRSGGEILEAIKSNSRMNHIPVVVLTSSNAVKDVISSYRMHANAYIVKPMDLNELFRIGKILGDFWLGCCRLPWSEPGPLPVRSEVNEFEYRA